LSQRRIGRVGVSGGKGGKVLELRAMVPERTKNTVTEKRSPQKEKKTVGETEVQKVKQQWGGRKVRRSPKGQNRKVS